MSDLLLRPATELRHLIATGELSALELVELTLQRIDERNSCLNAVVTLRSEQALDEARRATASPDGSLPLLGLPFTVKDTIDVAGLRSTGGSRLFQDRIASRSARTVERVRQAGAILIGKTNCAEFGIGNLETCSPLFGQTRNPWELDHSPGGSSGGDSTAVAAGLSSFGVGTDYGGSVRFPAHCTGIAALRPTPGRVPNDATLPELELYPPGVQRSFVQQELQTIGYQARGVSDLRLLLDVTSDRATVTPEPIRRCAWFVDDEADAEVTSTVGAAARALTDAGIQSKCAAPPNFMTAAGMLAELREAEGLPEIDYLSQGRRDELSAVVADMLDRPPTPVRPTLAGEIARLRSDVLDFLQRWPVLLLPVAATPAFPIAAEGKPDRSRLDLCSRAVTVLRLPAVVVICGTSSSGLPIGVQVVARPGHDEAALAVAQLLERSFGHWRRPSGMDQA